MPLSAEGCGGFKGSAYGLQLRRPALFGSLACLIWKGSAYGLQDPAGLFTQDCRIRSISLRAHTVSTGTEVMQSCLSQNASQTLGLWSQARLADVKHRFLVRANKEHAAEVEIELSPESYLPEAPARRRLYSLDRRHGRSRERLTLLSN